MRKSIFYKILMSCLGSWNLIRTVWTVCKRSTGHLSGPDTRLPSCCGPNTGHRNNISHGAGSNSTTALQQHGEGRRLRDWQLLLLSLSVFMTMCWCGDMMMLAKCSWCNICDIAPRMNENQDNLFSDSWQSVLQCCMHVSQKMCL